MGLFSMSGRKAPHQPRQRPPSTARIHGQARRLLWARSAARTASATATATPSRTRSPSPARRRPRPKRRRRLRVPPRPQARFPARSAARRCWRAPSSASNAARSWAAGSARSAARRCLPARSSAPNAARRAASALRHRGRRPQARRPHVRRMAARRRAGPRPVRHVLSRLARKRRAPQRGPQADQTRAGVPRPRRPLERGEGAVAVRAPRRPRWLGIVRERRRRARPRALLHGAKPHARHLPRPPAVPATAVIA